MKTECLLALSLFMLCGCASAPPEPPFPAFVVVDELPDAFLAGLPGVRAKQLSVDPRTQRGSYRITTPPDWSFTTGASPIHSVEIYMLAGEATVGEFALRSGGYVYVPPGASGVRVSSETGATFLYFLDDADPSAVIQTPIISSSELIEWQPVDIGIVVRELRNDPGSGARTWLMRITPEAMLGWQQSSQNIEGYLVRGAMSYSECVAGEPYTAEYRPGGYFHRPPGAVHGGPDTRTTDSATWLLRARGKEEVLSVNVCAAENAPQ